MLLALFVCSYLLLLINSAQRLIKASYINIGLINMFNSLSYSTTYGLQVTTQTLLYSSCILFLLVATSKLTLATITISIGLLYLLQSSNLIVTFICLELINISLYVLVIRSGIKYIITSLIITTLFVLGITFSYAEPDMLGSLWPILLTFLLKLGIFPFHKLTADLYEGIPTKVMIIIQILKLGIYLFVINWLDCSILGIVSYASLLGLTILVGVLSTQSSAFTLKRFISLSSSSYQTLLLIGSCAGLGYAMSGYAIVYIVTLTVIMISQGPIVTALFLSIAGLPPFIGFYFKLYLISDLLNTEAYWLLVLFLISSLILTANYLERTQTFNAGVIGKSGVITTTTTGILLLWSIIG